MPAVTAPADPRVVMQGIEVNKSSINPAAFQRLTRRLTFQQKSFTYGGLGTTDNVQILQTGIVSQIQVKVAGTLTVTVGTGTVATTAMWPYNLAKAIRFTANGQSNLINASGTSLKAREIMQRGDLTDRGVVRGIGGASPGTSVQQGTLSLNNEVWGVGQNVTAIPGAPTNYPVALEWTVPVAFDQLGLVGAIFAQTASSELALSIDWAPLSDLFTLTGNATVSLALTVTIVGTVYSIPEANGGIVIPDLSVFHSLVESRYSSVANGVNEVRLTGQGVGKQLLRVYWRVLNGAAPGVPLAVNSTNFATQGWRYGGNDTPELYPDGATLAMNNEKLFDADLATYAGYSVMDFANENAFRDSVDEGTATELRLVCEIPNGVTLTTPALLYTQEALAAGAAA